MWIARTPKAHDQYVEHKETLASIREKDIYADEKREEIRKENVKFVGKMVKASVTGETMSQPEYTGTGMLVLEPSFRHFLVLQLGPGESIVVDDGMFYCAQGSVQVKVIAQKRMSAAVAGGETFFQQQLTGPGLIVLESVVPMEEIDIIRLNNDVLKVDGNFAILRSSSLDFTVERSAKTLIGSAMSGEGLVNVYRGTGEIWLAPTIKVYKAMNL